MKDASKLNYYDEILIYSSEISKKNCFCIALFFMFSFLFGRNGLPHFFVQTYTAITVCCNVCCHLWLLLILRKMKLWCVHLRCSNIRYNNYIGIIKQPLNLTLLHRFNILDHIVILLSTLIILHYTYL